jgi:hypothetical protein
MNTRKKLDEAKALAQDVLDDGRYLFRSCEHRDNDHKWLTISDKEGTWSGFYRTSSEGSYFVVVGFRHGVRPPMIYTRDWWQIVKHFEILEGL